jgi:hypothetical protein
MAIRRDQHNSGRSKAIPPRPYGGESCITYISDPQHRQVKSLEADPIARGSRVLAHIWLAHYILAPGST